MRKRSITASILAGLCAVIGTGCAPEVRSASFLTSPLPAAPSTAPVVIYQTQAPPCPVEELGTVTARGEFSTERLIAAMRARAKNMGGDAIINYTFSEPVAAVIVPESVPVATPVRVPTVSGTVVRFRDSTCATSVNGHTGRA